MGFVEGIPDVLVDGVLAGQNRKTERALIGDDSLCNKRNSMSSEF